MADEGGGGKELVEREQEAKDSVWGGYSFLARSLAQTVSLSNVWRLPWILYQFGASFWIAYLILAMVIGFPLFLLEAGLGQFSSTGSLLVSTTLLPGLEGFGLASLGLSFISLLLHGSLTSYALYYTLNAINSPWRQCRFVKKPRPWDRLINSPVCFTTDDKDYCVRNQPRRRLFVKGKCYDNDNASELIRNLSACVLGHEGSDMYAHPDEPTTWHCSFRLRFFFNQTTIIDLPDMSEAYNKATNKEVDSPHSACAQNLDSIHRCLDKPPVKESEKADLPWLVTHYNKCNGSMGIVWAKDHRLRINERIPNERGVTDPFFIDLAHTQSYSIADAAHYQNRANCFAVFLFASSYDTYCEKTHQGVEPSCRHIKSKPNRVAVRQLECLVKRYCQITWPSEELTTIDCLRRVIDPRESYATEEFFMASMGQTQLEQERKGKPSLSWQLDQVVCLALTWIGVGLVLMRPELRANLTSVTMGMAMVLSFLFCVMILTFPGQLSGIRYAFYPQDWACKLALPQVWAAALAQLLHSLNLGLGSLTTIASFNRFHTHILRDTLVVLVIDTLFSILVSCGVFGLLGHMADQANTGVQDFLRTKSGATFIALSQAGTEMWDGKTMSVLFFAGMSLVGLNSVVGMTEAFLANMQDRWQKTVLWPQLLLWSTLSICFLSSFLCVSHLGMRIVVFMDSLVWNNAVPLLLTAQLIIIIFCYGVMALLKDFRLMISHRDWDEDTVTLFFRKNTLERGWFKYYLTLSWALLAPVTLVLLIAFYYTHEIHLIRHSRSSLPLYFLLAKVAGGPGAVVMVVTGWLVYRTWAGGRVRLGFPELWKTSPLWGPAHLIAAAYDSWERHIPFYRLNSADTD